MKQPGVIVVVPPWPLGGSGNIFAAQVDYHRRSGRAVLLVITNHEAQYWPSGFDDWQVQLSTQFAEVTSLPKEKIRCVACNAIPSSVHSSSVIFRRFDVVKSAKIDLNVIDFIKTHRVTHLHVNHVYSLGLVDQLRWACLRFAQTWPSLVVETHDVQSHAISVQGQSAWYGCEDIEETLFSNEVSLLSRADVLVHISPKDDALFRQALPRHQHFYVRGTIAPKQEHALRASPDTASGDWCDLLYVGDGHSGNVETLREFFLEVFPLVLAAKPTFKVTIIGEVRELFGEREPELYESVKGSFLGRVESVAELYAGARMVFAASRNSTGSSIKLIEALCSGRPVVTNAEGSRGLDGLPLCRDLFIASDAPGDLAQTILAALLPHSEREGISGRELFARFFSNEVYRRDMTPVFAHKIRRGVLIVLTEAIRAVFRKR